MDADVQSIELGAKKLTSTDTAPDATNQIDQRQICETGCELLFILSQSVRMMIEGQLRIVSYVRPACIFLPATHGYGHFLNSKTVPPTELPKLDISASWILSARYPCDSFSVLLISSIMGIAR